MSSECHWLQVVICLSPFLISLFPMHSLSLSLLVLLYRPPHFTFPISLSSMPSLALPAVARFPSHPLSCSPPSVGFMQCLQWITDENTPGYVENESESVLNTIIFSPIRILSVCEEVSVYLTKCHTTPVIISCGVSLSTVLCCLSSPVKRQVTCPSSSRTLRRLSMKSKCHRAR